MNPAHLHLIVNHVPVLGSIFAALLLAWGLARRQDSTVLAGLVVTVLAALGGAGAYLTGEPAEEAIEEIPGVSGRLIHRHEEAALVAAIVLGVAGLAALAALLRSRRTGVYGLAILTFVLTLGGVATMGWTANLGGEIRHPEIRSEAARAEAARGGSAEDEAREGGVRAREER